MNKDQFYLNMKCDAIDTNSVGGLLSNVLWDSGQDIPTGESIVVFNGIVSQNYGKGEMSRNKYKYSQDGWQFDHYANNPIILWQHNQDYGGIGRAKAFYKNSSGDLAGIFWVDLDMLEPRNAKQVKKGLVNGISTGAITVEDGFEEKETGKIYSQKDAEEKFGWENVFDALFGVQDAILTYVITKAKMLENSLVTIGSNEKAIAYTNSMDSILERKADEYKQNHLSTNPTTMEKNNQEETPIVPVVPSQETPPPPTVDTPLVPAEGEGKVENNGINTDALAEIATLKNKITELESNHAKALEETKAQYDAQLTSEINKVREEERANLATIVSGKTDSVTTTDFAKKYSV